MVLICGLPASGKTTIGQGLCEAVRSQYQRTVTFLDGDEVRRNLSPDLGFSREHRELHLTRMAYLAAEVARHGGLTVCAAVAPHTPARKAARAQVEAHGRFVLVYLSTPRHVCEHRDPKGLYARSRAGLLENSTGVADDYEPPHDADLIIDTSLVDPVASVGQILRVLRSNLRAR